MKKITAIVLTALSLQLAGCATTTQDSTSGVKRSQFLLMPASSVDSMSAQAYTATLKEAEQKKTLNADKAMLARVRGISNR